MKFRHEWKHEITVGDCFELCARLSAVAYHDSNGDNGCYSVRSLYFDDLRDTALLEKINGVSRREKFRIRYYNMDTSYICLEKKSKVDKLCHKESQQISKEETESLLAGDTEWMSKSDSPLLREFYCKLGTKGLRPKTVVDYLREAYVFPAGNVRVTMDSNIRTGIWSIDFLNPDCVTVPAGNNTIILEVKWDEFLPDIIRDAVQLNGRRASAFSKYAACRIYD